MQTQILIFIFLGALMNYARASVVELIVTKYQALDYTEIRDVKNKRYSFNFCLCTQPTAHPTTDHSCECKMNRLGKTAAESVPKVIFPSSCLYTSDENKCLTASFGSASSRYLYASVQIDARVLTKPEWQSLQVTRYKKTVKLASCGNSKFIELTYSVLGDKKETEILPTHTEHKVHVEQPHAYAHPRTNAVEALQRFMRTHHTPPQQHVNHAQGHQTITITRSRVSKNEGPKFKLESAKNFRDITLYLMELSLQQRVKPTNFDIPAFKQAVLQANNRYRYIHGVAPLSYDKAAENEAQTWARNLASRQICLEHDPKRKYGENLFYFAFDYYTDAVSMADALTYGFYIEGRGYNYNTIPSDYYNRGHFTQMIWAASQRMGVGIAISYYNGRRTNSCQPSRPAYMLYVVVKYDPPGNVRTKRAFIDNVRPVMRKL
uniref:SCP domain-containing protein n=1 Tax=Acrobeloides nanus TaxID=290746 RepID=A0A914E8C9_9BILA